MKLARTFIFILLFTSVAGLYVYQKRLAKEALTNNPDEVNRGIVISKDDVIDRIDLQDHVQKTRITIRQEKGIWRLELPVRYPMEQGIPGGFVTAARMASRQPRLRVEKEWGEYGLEKPDLEITFDISGDRSETLLFGAPVPVGKAVFARWKGERGYFLLAPEMKAMFRQTVYALREKRVFLVPADALRKIAIEMGDQSCEWKKDGSFWYWFEPVSKFGQKMSQDELDLVAQTLRNLHVKEFLDNNQKSMAELGFFMIHDRIRLEAEGGKVETLHFGNEVPEKNAYYAFREGDATVFLVDRVNVIALFDLVKKYKPEVPANTEEESATSLSEGDRFPISSATEAGSFGPSQKGGTTL